MSRSWFQNRAIVIHCMLESVHVFKLGVEKHLRDAWFGSVLSPGREAVRRRIGRRRILDEGVLVMHRARTDLDRSQTTESAPELN